MYTAPVEKVEKSEFEQFICINKIWSTKPVHLISQCKDACKKWCVSGVHNFRIKFGIFWIQVGYFVKLFFKVPKISIADH